MFLGGGGGEGVCEGQLCRVQQATKSAVLLQLSLYIYYRETDRVSMTAR